MRYATIGNFITVYMHKLLKYALILAYFWIICQFSIWILNGKCSPSVKCAATSVTIWLIGNNLIAAAPFYLGVRHSLISLISSCGSVMTAFSSVMCSSISSRSSSCAVCLCVRLVIFASIFSFSWITYSSVCTCPIAAFIIFSCFFFEMYCIVC